jgi:hypothetical protein
MEDQQRNQLESAATGRLLSAYQRASPVQQERVNTLIETGYLFAARLCLARFAAEGDLAA